MSHTFHGPLRRCPANPRYFTDDTGRAIYLSGSHTWAVFQDLVPLDGKRPTSGAAGASSWANTSPAATSRQIPAAPPASCRNTTSTG